jgi:hypothetical protein
VHAAHNDRPGPRPTRDCASADCAALNSGRPTDGLGPLVRCSTYAGEDCSSPAQDLLSIFAEVGARWWRLTSLAPLHIWTAYDFRSVTKWNPAFHSGQYVRMPRLAAVRENESPCKINRLLLNGVRVSTTHLEKGPPTRSGPSLGRKRPRWAAAVRHVSQLREESRSALHRRASLLGSQRLPFLFGVAEETRSSAPLNLNAS